MKQLKIVLLMVCLPWNTWADKPLINYHSQIIHYQGENFSAQVPLGYQLELLNAELDGPRLFQFASNGDLIIGSKSGRVYRMEPPYNKAQVLIELGDYPHSVAFRDDKIFIARTSGVYQANYQPGQKRIKRRHLKLVAALPGGGGHNSRSIAVGPDKRLYASLGISGNCSNQYLGEEYPFIDRRGGIFVLDESKPKDHWRAYGAGLRNPIGFDWHPQTEVLYASNNGPDHRGYDLPPEYFSKVEANSFHGMPWFQYNGKTIERDNCIAADPPQSLTQVVKPVLTFPARNAPMGVAFVPAKSFDKAFRYDAIVALHGSWATQPDGGFLGSRASRRVPKIVIARFENGEAKRVDDFITGFQLANGKRWGRPMGVGFGPDGSLYFSSDGGQIEGMFRLRKK